MNFLEKESTDALKKASPKSNVVYEIEKLKKQREERRMAVEQKRKAKAEKIIENEAKGKLGIFYLPHLPKPQNRGC